MVYSHFPGFTAFAMVNMVARLRHARSLLPNLLTPTMSINVLWNGSHANPMETLDAAATHIAAGRVQDGARLAYDAAFRAVTEAARRHHRPCETVEDARDFVRWLDGLPTEPDDWLKDAPIFDWLNDDHAPQLPIPEFVGAFDVAETFKRHGEAPAEFTNWEPDEYVIFLPAVRWLIEELKTAQPRDPSVWTR